MTHASQHGHMTYDLTLMTRQTFRWYTDKQTNGHTDGQMDREAVGWMDRWIDGQTAKQVTMGHETSSWMHGWMDGWIDGQTAEHR